MPDDAIPPLSDQTLGRGLFSYAPSALRSHMTETVATLREVALMARDITPVLPCRDEPCDDVVVLIHGFFASAGVFRPMRQQLIANTNAKIASFSHAPGARIERIARSLARLVARIPATSRVHPCRQQDGHGEEGGCPHRSRELSTLRKSAHVGTPRGYARPSQHSAF